jgi:hypothetical protein
VKTCELKFPNLGKAKYKIRQKGNLTITDK